MCRQSTNAKLEVWHSPVSTPFLLMLHTYITSFYSSSLSQAALKTPYPSPTPPNTPVSQSPPSLLPPQQSLPNSNQILMRKGLLVTPVKGNINHSCSQHVRPHRGIKPRRQPDKKRYHWTIWRADTSWFGQVRPKNLRILLLYFD